MLFSGRLWDASHKTRNGYDGARSYDSARSGQKFLTPWKEEDAPIIVELNWWTELEKKLGQ